jgi:excisionase family DNA binding protein
MRLVDATIADLVDALRPMVRHEIDAALMQRMGEPQRYLTMQGAAELFRVPRHVIRDAVRRGEVKGFKVGRQYRFRLSDLEAWATARAAAG